MDFELTKEQKDIRQASREFAEGEIRDIAREYDQKEEFPMELWKKACDLGFVGVYIDEAYDGPGLEFFEASLIMEEFWRVDPGCGCLLLTAFGSELIQSTGTEQQKKRYIPPIPRRDAIMGSAVTEPDAGSDIFGVNTSAVKDGGEYVINGTKMFITNGSIADYLLVYCLTDPDTKSRDERYSIFIVERDRPGFQANKLKGKLGIRASNTAETVLSDVRFPQGKSPWRKRGARFSSDHGPFQYQPGIGSSPGCRGSPRGP